MSQRRQDLLTRLTAIQTEMEPVIELFTNEEVLADISKNANRPDALRASLQKYGVSVIQG